MTAWHWIWHEAEPWSRLPTHMGVRGRDVWGMDPNVLGNVSSSARQSRPLCCKAQKAERMRCHSHGATPHHVQSSTYAIFRSAESEDGLNLAPSPNGSTSKNPATNFSRQCYSDSSHVNLDASTHCSPKINDHTVREPVRALCLIASVFDSTIHVALT